MIVWMYFETDGDAGYYHIRLFWRREVAEAYHKTVDSAYGRVEEIEIV